MVCCWPMACCLSGLVCKGRLHICLLHVCACYVSSLALLAAMAALAELARPMVITTSVHVRLLVQLHLSTCKYASVLPWPVLLSNIYMSIPLLWWASSLRIIFFSNVVKRALGGPEGPWGGTLGGPDELYFPYPGLLRCGEHLRCNLHLFRGQYPHCS